MSGLANVRNKIAATGIADNWSNRFGKIKLPEKLKGTIVEKWVNYWKQLFTDYKDVMFDTAKYVVDHPVKSSIYGTLGTAIYVMSKNNPDLDDFKEQFLKHNHELIMVHESCQNPVSANHIKNIERWYNQGQIRRLSLGVISFIWIDNFDQSCSLYKATCEYLKPRYLNFNERIVDIGFWNKFWWLEEKMVEYDVNF